MQLSWLLFCCARSNSCLATHQCITKQSFIKTMPQPQPSPKAWQAPEGTDQSTGGTATAVCAFRLTNLTNACISVSDIHGKRSLFLSHMGAHRQLNSTIGCMWEFTPPLAKLLQNGAWNKGSGLGHEPLSQNVAEAAAMHHHWRPMLLYSLTSRDQLASQAFRTRENFKAESGPQHSGCSCGGLPPDVVEEFQANHMNGSEDEDISTHHLRRGKSVADKNWFAYSFQVSRARPYMNLTCCS